VRAFHPAQRLDAVCAWRQSLVSEMQDAIAAQPFPEFLTIAGVEFSRVTRIAHQRVCASSRNAPSSHRHRCVNTSLSGTLFFSMCWCIRKVCISIPECTQRLEPSHLTPGGQHGQESEEGKEGEEGEERSEEDCEEDPQGRQEEEVSSPYGIAGGLMPATSLEPKRVCFLKTDFQSRLRSMKEGVGETSGQTVGSSVSGFPRQPVRQKSAVNFIGGLRSVRIPISAMSPVASAAVRVDPDVFTDALVHRCGSSPGAAVPDHCI
jgi:hypothetical protein